MAASHELNEAVKLLPCFSSNMYHLRCIHSFVLSLLGIAARAWRAPSRSIRRTAQASLTEEQKKLLCPLPSLPFLHLICASVLSFPSPSFLFPLFRFRPATAPRRDQPTPPPFTPDQPRVRPPPSDPPPPSSHLLLPPPRGLYTTRTSTRAKREPLFPLYASV